ncbi:MAG: aldo/keto reductase [Flavobacterium sp.]|jgi:predicted oxidoreductase|uniref:aldo/keto reductase n=1 Tax=Flavobacterium sp. TaxID=239 RepID=UPI0035B3B6CF
MSIPLSSIIAGTMNWGVWGKHFNTREMEQLILQYLEEGVTTFDHADIYGGYTTEASFGKAWSALKLPREQVQFISKCGIKYPSEARPYSLKHYDYSKEYILWSVEQSLKNLQTDYLDVLLLHRPSPLMQPEVIADAVTELKISGKIVNFGLSNFTPSQTELIRRHTAVTFNQIQFSATHLEPMLDGTLDYMQHHSIKPMAWNPLGTVFRVETPQTLRLRSLLERLTAKYQVTSELLLLQWIVRHPALILPVIGTTNLERIRQLNQLNQFELELEDWFAIWIESQGNKVP